MSNASAFLTVRLISVIGNVRTTVGIYMPMRALEHIFGDLLSARKFTPYGNSTPNRRAWGWFSRFPVCHVHDNFTLLGSSVQRYSAGTVLKFLSLGSPAKIHSSKLHLISQRKSGGELHLVHSPQRAVQKTDNNKENKVTLCYRTRHRRRDIW